jgi:hypothetical protein
MPEYHELLRMLRGMDSPEVSAGRPARAGAVADAESALGIVFPPRYRRFLETLGWVEVQGREVFGIADEPEVVAHSREWRGVQGVPARAVIVEVDALEGDPVGFVPDQADAGAEPPLWRWEPGRAVRVAADFGDYLAVLAQGLVAQRNDAAAPLFDPPWGQRREGGSVVADRKEVKVAGMLVQRIKYDGVSPAAVAGELNARRIPARRLPGWTAAAVREAYEAWKDRY